MNGTQGVWLITGVSTGLGRAMAEAALAAGVRVAGTVRRGDDKASFEAIAPGRAAGVMMDLSDTAALAQTVDRIERDIGPIEVLVNNAGYGLEGLIEEVSIEDVRRQFEVNVFGVLAVTKAVLPHMRARRRGRIINISSATTAATPPAIGLYAATKGALNVLSEVLAKEVAPLGVHVTAVQPGAFRTDWGGRSLIHARRAIADYDATIEPQRTARAERSGAQRGDPKKFGREILRLAQMPDPPLNFILGADALGAHRMRLDQLKAEIELFERTSPDTDFA